MTAIRSSQRAGLTEFTTTCVSSRYPYSPFPPHRFLPFQPSALLGVIIQIRCEYPPHTMPHISNISSQSLPGYSRTHFSVGRSLPPTQRQFLWAQCERSHELPHESYNGDYQVSRKMLFRCARVSEPLRVALDRSRSFSFQSSKTCKFPKSTTGQEKEKLVWMVPREAEGPFLKPRDNGDSGWGMCWSLSVGKEPIRGERESEVDNSFLENSDTHRDTSRFCRVQLGWCTIVPFFTHQCVSMAFEMSVNSRIHKLCPPPLCIPPATTMKQQVLPCIL